jgi:hypothetical protein
MGKVSNLVLEIQDLLVSGFDAEQISRRLDVPVNWVYEAADMMNDLESSDYDYMDGDHDSAMASAGWGTDESYGYYGEDY